MVRLLFLHVTPPPLALFLCVLLLPTLALPVQRASNKESLCSAGGRVEGRLKEALEHRMCLPHDNEM